MITKLAFSVNFCLFLLQAIKYLCLGRHLAFEAIFFPKELIHFKMSKVATLVAASRGNE